MNSVLSSTIIIKYEEGLSEMIPGSTVNETASMEGDPGAIQLFSELVQN